MLKPPVEKIHGKSAYDPALECCRYSCGRENLSGQLAPECLIPGFDGAIFSAAWKEALVAETLKQIFAADPRELVALGHEAGLMPGFVPR